jgi:hypothetical protein
VVLALPAGALARGGPPINDPFAGALPIAVNGSVVANNAGASLQAGEPQPQAVFDGTTGATLWYKFTAPAADLYTVEACSGDALFDNTVGVYHLDGGTLVSDLVEDASGDQECAPGAVASFNGVALTEYFVQVGGWDDGDTPAEDPQTGIVTVELTQGIVLPDNDDILNAEPINAGDSYGGDNTNAGPQTDEPVHAGGGTNSVWYRWTPTKTSRAQIDTCGAGDLDTVMAVYTDDTPGTDPSVDELTEVAANDDHPDEVWYCQFPTASYVEFDATQGATYYIAVAGYLDSEGTFNGVLSDGLGSTTITSGPEGTTNDPTPAFSFTTTSDIANGGTFGCSLDSISAPAIQFEDCGPSGTFTQPDALPDGAYVFTVFAQSTTGALELEFQTREFTVDTAVQPPTGDTTPPDTSITKGPKKKTAKKKAKFEFTSTEPGSTFECSVNGSPFAPCTSPHTVKGKKGKNKFAVRARDAAGNVDPTPATYSWKVKKKKSGSRGKAASPSSSRASAPFALRR